jgi:hypothetical protein
MGGSSWSDDDYTSRVSSKAASGVPTFDYDHKVRTGVVDTKVHDSLSIHGKIRESRDSAAHPESVAIGVVFDVTGSMASVPRVMQTKLPQLMGLLLRKGYVKDPQVLFGAIGDYFADKPIVIQMGQFESGVEMDDNLTNVVLHGGGGGSYEESYQDALYFFAHRTSIDCYEKRGKKGYLFLIGDEKPYPRSTRGELSALIGDGAQSDVSVEEIVAAVKEKYHVFFIIPAGTTHYGDRVLTERWAGLLGPENVIQLDKPDAVCETIGLAIGLIEGTATADGMATDLHDAGVDAAIVKATTKGLDALSKMAMVRVGGGSTLPEKTGGSKAVERL